MNSPSAPQMEHSFHGLDIVPKILDTLETLHIHPFTDTGARGRAGQEAEVGEPQDEVTSVSSTSRLMV